MDDPTSNQIMRHELGERLYKRILDEVYGLNLKADTPVTKVYMEWQKAIRRVLQDEGYLLPMIKVDGEWKML